jgi:hypothetical protein
MRKNQLLKELMLVEQDMRFRLALGRTRYTHRGGKGSIVEAVFRQFLREYTRLEIGNGEVIDTYGHKSAQTDAIIVGAGHPLIFHPEEHSLFLVEGILAAGEVKSILTKDLFVGTDKEKGALEKSSRFKKLTVKTTSGNRGAMSVRYSSTFLPFYVHRPYFLFAYESEMALETICKYVRDYDQEKKAKFDEQQQKKRDKDKEEANPFPTLDAIFVLGKGWVINFDGLGPIEGRQVDEMTGWKFQSSETVLADMLSWLSVVMPREQSPAALFYWYTKPW